MERDWLNVRHMSPVSITTEPVVLCAACGAKGEPGPRNCLDHVTGIPGFWNFFECPNCQSLWLNPCPVEADIPQLYPASYNLTRTPAPFLSDVSPGFNGSAKLAVLERFYGYRSLGKKGS